MCVRCLCGPEDDVVVILAHPTRILCHGDGSPKAGPATVTRDVVRYHVPV